MSDTTHYTGCTLVDELGERIGDISDVVFDAGSTTAEWLVVDPGRLRSERYVPANGSRRTARGDVVVPFRADTVKSSPKADRRHILSRDKQDLLHRQYHLEPEPHAWIPMPPRSTRREIGQNRTNRRNSVRPSSDAAHGAADDGFVCRRVHSGTG